MPALSVGLPMTTSASTTNHSRRGCCSVDHYGFEANVFRLVALRAGYISDPVGEIEGWSYGGGVSLPIGPWGSVGWQLASVPLAPDLDRQIRQGWTVWLHPESFFRSRP